MSLLLRPWTVDAQGTAIGNAFGAFTLRAPTQSKPVKGAAVEEDRVKGKGKELEGEAQQKWGEAKDKTRDVWEDVKDKAEDVVDRGEDRIDERERNEETARSSSR
jgi:uncharacterized protein YjbJ (UPF0337 family)